MAFNSDQEMVTLASSDPAWFHATLSVVASRNDLRNGTGEQPSWTSLYHRGEALRIIKQRLQESPSQISDTTVGAVATLAEHEVG